MLGSMGPSGMRVVSRWCHRRIRLVLLSGEETSALGLERADAVNWQAVREVDVSGIEPLEAAGATVSQTSFLSPHARDSGPGPRHR